MFDNHHFYLYKKNSTILLFFDLFSFVLITDCEISISIQMLSFSFFLSIIVSDGKIISSYRAQIFKYFRQCKARIYDGGSNRRRSKWKIIQPCDRYVPLSRYRQSADSKIVVVPRIIPDREYSLGFPWDTNPEPLFRSSLFLVPASFFRSLVLHSIFLSPFSFDRTGSWSLFSLPVPPMHSTFHGRMILLHQSTGDSSESTIWNVIILARSY